MLQKKDTVNYDKGKSDISDQVVVQLQSAQCPKESVCKVDFTDSTIAPWHHGYVFFGP